MRRVLICSLWLILFSRAHAQEQEKKLLDRLLKPDMSLENTAQQKQFVTTDATLTKTVPAKSFFVPTRKAEKGFWNTRQAVTKDFPAAPESPEAGKTATLSTRTKIAKVDQPYATAMYGDVRTAHDATKTEPGRDYPGVRPFLGRGKSQKALNAQDRPLTIDEVRELLNKSK